VSLSPVSQVQCIVLQNFGSAVPGNIQSDSLFSIVKEFLNQNNPQFKNKNFKEFVPWKSKK